MNNYFNQKPQKIILALVLSIAFITTVEAQEKVPDKGEVKTEQPFETENANSDFKTLFGDDIEYGGYGAISVGYTNLDDLNAFQFGVQGAWIIGHGVGIGIAARGFISETSSFSSDDEWSFLGGGYGGLFIEPIFFGKYPIHFTLPVIIGAGGLTYSSSNYNDFGYWQDINIWDDFFVIEPGIEMEMNITNFFRLAAGFSYRFASGVNLTYTEMNDGLGQQISVIDDLDGFNYRLSFKFGRF